MTRAAPLEGIRIIEVSLLGAALLTTPLVDLGADVIKVEPPEGDYGREMTWPIIEGTSLLFLHCNRGKRTVAIDLRSDAGKEVFEDLVRTADVVVDAIVTQSSEHSPFCAFLPDELTIMGFGDSRDEALRDLKSATALWLGVDLHDVVLVTPTLF